MQINKEQLAIELLDRIYVEASNIQNHLLDHPYAEENPHVQMRLQLAFETLMEAYNILPELEETYEEDQDSDNTIHTPVPVFTEPTHS